MESGEKRLKTYENSIAGLDLVEQVFSFGNRQYVIERVRNLDDLVNQVVDDDFNVDERLPYWAELWPSALGMSRFIYKNPDLIQGKSVVELGCGLGLTSLILSSQNPAALLLTDYEAGALQMTARNYRLNKMSPPAMQIMDWRSPDLMQSFQRIVASDVVYEERFFFPLIALFNSYLTSDGLIILAEPNRAIARRFFEMLHNYGFTISAREEIVEQDAVLIRVSIYLISKQK